MKALHVLTATSPCPTDLRDMDVYRVEVETDRMIRVEDIQGAVEDLTKEPVFQEDLTEALSERLAAIVRTVGVHDRTRTEVESGSLEREREPALA